MYLMYSFLRWIKVMGWTKEPQGLSVAGTEASTSFEFFPSRYLLLTMIPYRDFYTKVFLCRLSTYVITSLLLGTVCCWAEFS
jgi:hypothetical protein